MFSYELQQIRRSELQDRAAEWRLVQEAKAARADARRARKSAAHAAQRSGSTGDPSSDVTAAPVAGGTAAGEVVTVPLIKKAIHKLHLHSAA